MKINKADLQKALEKVKPGLANKEMIEQSTSFAFMGDRVVTYNDEISISHPVVGLNINGAVQAQALYSFLSKIKREEIEIEMEENQVRITSGKAKAGLVFEHEVKLPVEEIGEIGKWKKIPEGFLEALKFCHTCCSKDMSRPVLTCVYVDGKKVQASDSYQIVQYSLENKIPSKGFLIPASAVSALTKYAVKEISEGSGWYHFKTEEGTIFSTRVFNGQFPDIERFLEVEGAEINFPKTSISALDRAKVFAKGDSLAEDFPTVLVEIKDEQIKFSAQDKSGWFEETVKTTYKGEPVRFQTGIDFLGEVLTQTTDCVFGQNRIKFTGQNWIHIISTSDIKE